MCRWGMQATDRRGLQGSGYVRKPSPVSLAEILKGECSNRKGKEQHKHVHLVGGIARQAALYPPRPVRAVLKVVREELAERGQLNSQLRPST